MGNYIKKEIGITLIALVITIIVMLILVTVTIRVATNGALFQHAANAVKGTKTAIAGENDILNDELDKSIEDIVAKATGGAGGENPDLSKLRKYYIEGDTSVIPNADRDIKLAVNHWIIQYNNNFYELTYELGYYSNVQLIELNDNEIVIVMNDSKEMGKYVVSQGETWEQWAEDDDAEDILINRMGTQKTLKTLIQEKKDETENDLVYSWMTGPSSGTTRGLTRFESDTPENSDSVIVPKSLYVM